MFNLQSLPASHLNSLVFHRLAGKNIASDDIDDAKALGWLHADKTFHIQQYQALLVNHSQEEAQKAWYALCKAEKKQVLKDLQSRQIWGPNYGSNGTPAQLLQQLHTQLAQAGICLTLREFLLTFVHQQYWAQAPIYWAKLFANRGIVVNTPNSGTALLVTNGTVQITLDLFFFWAQQKAEYDQQSPHQIYGDEKARSGDRLPLAFGRMSVRIKDLQNNEVSLYEPMPTEKLLALLSNITIELDNLSLEVYDPALEEALLAGSIQLALHKIRQNQLFLPQDQIALSKVLIRHATVNFTDPSGIFADFTVDDLFILAWHDAVIASQILHHPTLHKRFISGPHASVDLAIILARHQATTSFVGLVEKINSTLAELAAKPDQPSLAASQTETNHSSQHIMLGIMPKRAAHHPLPSENKTTQLEPPTQTALPLAKTGTLDFLNGSTLDILVWLDEDKPTENRGQALATQILHTKELWQRFRGEPLVLRRIFLRAEPNTLLMFYQSLPEFRALLIADETARKKLVANENPEQLRKLLEIAPVYLIADIIKNLANILQSANTQITMGLREIYGEALAKLDLYYLVELVHADKTLCTSILEQPKLRQRIFGCSHKTVITDIFDVVDNVYRKKEVSVIKLQAKAFAASPEHCKESVQQNLNLVQYLQFYADPVLLLHLVDSPAAANQLLDQALLSFRVRMQIIACPQVLQKIMLMGAIDKLVKLYLLEPRTRSTFQKTILESATPAQLASVYGADSAMRVSIGSNPQLWQKLLAAPLEALIIALLSESPLHDSSSADQPADTSARSSLCTTVKSNPTLFSKILAHASTNTLAQLALHDNDFCQAIQKQQLLPKLFADADANLVAKLALLVPMQSIIGIPTTHDVLVQRLFFSANPEAITALLEHDRVYYMPKLATYLCSLPTLAERLLQNDKLLETFLKHSSYVHPEIIRKIICLPGFANNLAKLYCLKNNYAHWWVSSLPLNLKVVFLTTAAMADPENLADLFLHVPLAIAQVGMQAINIPSILKANKDLRKKMVIGATEEQCKQLFLKDSELTVMVLNDSLADQDMQNCLQNSKQGLWSLAFARAGINGIQGSKADCELADNLIENDLFLKNAEVCKDDKLNFIMQLADPEKIVNKLRWLPSLAQGLANIAPEAILLAILQRLFSHAKPKSLAELLLAAPVIRKIIMVQPTIFHAIISKISSEQFIDLAIQLVQQKDTIVLGCQENAPTVYTQLQEVMLAPSQISQHHFAQVDLARQREFLTHYPEQMPHYLRDRRSWFIFTKPAYLLGKATPDEFVTLFCADTCAVVKAALIRHPRDLMRPLVKQLSIAHITKLFAKDPDFVLQFISHHPKLQTRLVQKNNLAQLASMIMIRPQQARELIKDPVLFAEAAKSLTSEQLTQLAKEHYLTLQQPPYEALWISLNQQATGAEWAEIFRANIAALKGIIPPEKLEVVWQQAPSDTVIELCEFFPILPERIFSAEENATRFRTKLFKEAKPELLAKLYSFNPELIGKELVNHYLTLSHKKRWHKSVALMECIGRYADAHPAMIGYLSEATLNLKVGRNAKPRFLDHFVRGCCKQGTHACLHNLPNLMAQVYEYAQEDSLIELFMVDNSVQERVISDNSLLERIINRANPSALLKMLQLAKHDATTVALRQKLYATPTFCLGLVRMLGDNKPLEYMQALADPYSFLAEVTFWQTIKNDDTLKRAMLSLTIEKTEDGDEFFATGIKLQELTKYHFGKFLDEVGKEDTMQGMLKDFKSRNRAFIAENGIGLSPHPRPLPQQKTAEKEGMLPPLREEAIKSNTTIRGRGLG